MRNTSLWRRYLFIPFFTVGFTLSSSEASAQAASPQTEYPQRSAEALAELQQSRELLAQASVAAKSGNAAAAENAVVALNRAPTGSSEWHVEAAQRLIHLAESIAKQGKAQQSEALIQRGLGHLEGAEKLATRAEQKARIMAFTAYIYERFIGDLEKAAECHQAALEYSPTGSAASKEALERLKYQKKAPADSRTK